MESHFKGLTFFSFSLESDNGDGRYQAIDNFFKYIARKHMIDFSLTMNKKNHKFSMSIDQSDCGVFMIAYASCIIDDLPLSFEASDLLHLKKNLIIDIVTKNLRY